MFARLCILFTFVTGLNAFAEKETIKTLSDKIEKSSCEQFLTIAPPEEPGSAPIIPSLWKTAGETLLLNFKSIGKHLQAIEDHAAHGRAVNEYRQYLSSLQSRKETVRQKWTEKFSSDPSGDVAAFTNITSQLYQKGYILISKASTEQQLLLIENFLDTQRKKIFSLITEIQAKQKQAEAVFNNLQKQMSNSPHWAEVNKVIESTLKDIHTSSSAEDIVALMTETEERILPLLHGHIENERVRPALELRFDPKDPKDTIKILEAFISLQNTTSLPINKNFLSAFLESNRSAREFLNYELQMSRRLLKTADRSTSKAEAEEIRAGVALRITNDLEALTQEYSTEKPMVALIKTLRKNLLTLNHNNLFQGIEGADDLKRMNVLNREALVRDALALKEIQVMIQTAALDLMTSLTPPVLPTEPSRTPPEVPSIPRKARSRSHANQLQSKISQYKRDVEQYKKSWEDYQKAVPLFRDKLVPEYRKQAEGLKSALISRHLARLSYISFLSLHYPHLFSNSATAEKIRLKTVKQASLKEADKAREEAKKRDESFSSSDWLTYYYMMNPIWMINRDIAIMAPLYYYHHYDVTPKTQKDDENQVPIIVNLDSSRQDIETPADIQMPAVALTDTPIMPELNNIDIKLPDMPDIQLPDVQSLDIQVPNIDDIKIPDVNVDIVVPDIPTTIETPSISIDVSPPSIDISL